MTLEEKRDIGQYSEGFNRGYDAGSLDGGDAAYREVTKALKRFREEAALITTDPIYFMALDDVWELLGIKT